MTALAWTLVHFIWEGVLVALAAAAVLRMPGLRSSTRYVIGVAALAGMLAAPVATFVALSTADREHTRTGRVASATPVEATVSVAALPARDRAPSPVARSTGNERRDYAPLVVWSWAAGVLALSFRLLEPVMYFLLYWAREFGTRRDGQAHSPSA
ncbi:MAG: hypothetical protein ABI051_19130, partial [Vicinamibacterales bacterium]